MALEDLISQFNASISIASEWANLALSPSTYQDLGLVAKCAAQASSNLSVATQFKIDLESLLTELESNLSDAINKGENVSTLDYLKAELNSTRSAEQKANAELRAATSNVELALKSVEVLLEKTGDVVELPNNLISAIEAVCDATLTIGAASLEASDVPEFAIEAAEQINREIEKLDEARSELDTARADLLEAMQKMGSPASPGLSALAGLQIAIGSLIEETQATLTAFQEDDQTIHSFSQLEKFAEAIQQIAAQAESAVEQDNILKASLHLRDQNNKMSEPIKTINGVSLSTAADQYIIIKGNSPSIPITINGQPTSKTNPGGGWQAIGVTSSKSGNQYELIWKNSKTDQFVSWKLGLDGAFIKGDLLSASGLLDLEDSFKSDLDGKNGTGWDFKDDDKISDNITLIKNNLAYAIRDEKGAIVKITFNGSFASDNNPGDGWVAIAAAPTENGNYYLYWENKANQDRNLVRWEVSSSGSYRDGKVLSESELNLDELNLQEDLNDDQRIGPFQKVEGTITPDNLTANPEQPFQVLYGRQGEDLLKSSSPNSLGFDLLIGGPGNDSYEVPGGTSALIIEQGNNDPLDELIASSINTSRSNFATLEQGRHLGIFDQTSDTSLFIYDWQKQANRIEVFYMQDKAFTFDQFKQAVIPAGQPLPDLTWGQWDQQFGIGHISHIGLAEGITLTKLAETYSNL